MQRVQNAVVISVAVVGSQGFERDRNAVHILDLAAGQHACRLHIGPVGSGDHGDHATAWCHVGLEHGPERDRPLAAGLRHRGRTKRRRPEPGGVHRQEVDLGRGADRRRGRDRAFHEQAAGAGVPVGLRGLQQGRAPRRRAAAAGPAGIDDHAVGHAVEVAGPTVHQVQHDGVALDLRPGLAVIQERHQRAGRRIFLVVAARRGAGGQDQLDHR